MQEMLKLYSISSVASEAAPRPPAEEERTLMHRLAQMAEDALRTAEDETAELFLKLAYTVLSLAPDPEAVSLAQPA